MDEIDKKLKNPTEQIYLDIHSMIQKEIFSYFPAFPSSLTSLELEFSIYEQIALGAKKSGDFDWIIIDAESTFDKEKIQLFNRADKVLIIMDQTLGGVIAVNNLLSNIEEDSIKKCIFICNRFKQNVYNALQ